MRTLVMKKYNKDQTKLCRCVGCTPVMIDVLLDDRIRTTARVTLDIIMWHSATASEQ